jgi:arabinofuranan 3-O-arabinosyltransferase
MPPRTPHLRQRGGPWRRRAIPLSLAGGAYLLAVLQRPGRPASDTKIDLHVDPVGFLGRVGDVWSNTAGLGHVQGGQYGGYLWPTGPFFAALDATGLSPWLVQRLWLGTLLALAAWGAVWLLDELLSPRRGVSHLVAGALYALNPYVIVWSSRTTTFLIGYAALPWLLLVVKRGVRDPSRLWWTAAFALIVTSTGGGVNAAVTAWLMIGPALLLVYEPLLSGVAWRNAAAFAGRAVVAAALASAWWIVPLLVQASYGLNFLPFTEQVGSIWNTTSLTESLRLMGYWPSYLGVGYGDVLEPYFGSSRVLLFDPPVVVASLLVPGLALAGFAWTRRWRYGPFFLALALLGALIMSVGYPPGTPLRKAASFTYSHVEAAEFLRTTYKAGPLVALSLACLAGAAAREMSRRLRTRPRRLVTAAAGAAIVVLAALPLFQGRAVELTWGEIPAAWTRVARGLERELPPSSRALVLPGQAFAFYDWGGTVDPILPSLTDRPVAVRNVPPYDDIHAVDLLWTLDNLVQQQRLLPGGLPPLLDLMSVRAVVTGTDDDSDRSGALPPEDAARQLASQPGLGNPSGSYGPVRRFNGVALPQVRRYDVQGSRPLVRLEPLTGATVVDGSAAGVANVGSLGWLMPRAPLLYAGDLSPGELRAQALRGGSVAITDSNRRRSFLASRPRAPVGWTLPPDVAFSEEAALLDPFAHRGSAAQTVASYAGARYVKAPYSSQVAQFAEHRPFAAFDGDPSTAWQPDPTLEDPSQWVELGLAGERDVPFVDLLPDDSNPRVAVTQVSIAGREFPVRQGWNRLPVAARQVDALRVTITGHRTNDRDAGGVGGLREVRVPGVRVVERLRPPTLAERALRGADLSSTALAYVFERTTADNPFGREAVPPPPPRSGNRVEAEAALGRAAQDPEIAIERVFAPPAERRWSADGWATVSPATPDPVVDTLAGTRTAGARFWSSGRSEGRPGARASAAFDGARERAWAAPWTARRGAWIAWRVPRPVVLRRLVLERAPPPARAPLRVELSHPGGRTGALGVGRDGSVTVPRPVRATRFRLEVVEATPGPAPAVAIGELRAPGIPRARPRPAAAPLRAQCGVLAAAVDGRRLPLGLRASTGQLDSGRPLRVRSCAPPLELPARRVVLRTEPGVLRPYVLALRSPAPAPAPRPPRAAGAVTATGREGRGSYTGVRVAPRGPSRLVLGESYSRGWRATCDGRSLGRPEIVDGFANGWRVSAGCRDVSFRFAPQDAVDAGHWVGGAACALLVAILLLRRPPRRRSAAPPPSLFVDDRPAPWPVRAAAVAGLGAGVVLGFTFAIRAGVVIAPAVALILWRGWSPRALILAAGALLVIVVPVLYLLFPGQDRGGYDTEYAVEHLGAHWVAVAAVVLLLMALARTLNTAIRQSRDPVAAPAAEPATRAPA